MILEMVTTSLAILFWSFGFCLAITSLFSKTDKLAGFIMSIFIFGLLGAAFFCPSVDNIVNDVRTEYVTPDYIVRTNDTTHVMHIIKNCGYYNVYTKSYTDVKYWNATNIQVKVISGKNLWKNEVDSEYEIVLRTE